MKSKAQIAVQMARKMLRGMPSYDKADPRANVVDALTNLRHYCYENQIGFEMAANMSLTHYASENQGDTWRD